MWVFLTTPVEITRTVAAEMCEYEANRYRTYNPRDENKILKKKKKVT